MGYDNAGFCTKCGYRRDFCACPQPKPTMLAMQHANGEAVKHDSGKPDYTLMPTEAMDEIAAVWTFGQRKYAAFNWANGFKWRRPLAAALRHIYAYLRGEDKDPESGLSHLAHAICCLCMVITFEKTQTGEDDRHDTTRTKK